ncbi:MAG: YecA family protein [Gammaproteobacteria bacterium]|nr:YecA family protein [Gammaproteobacteria bacterium]
MSDTKFTLQALQTLHNCFPAEGGEQKLSFHRLKGFLSAVASAPHAIPFANWWGALKDLPELEIDSETENELLPIMMTLMDKTVESLAANQMVSPEPVNLGEYDYGSTPIEQWCHGYMDGIKLSEEVWFSMEDEQERDGLELSFGIVAMLATRENMRRKVDAEQFETRMEAAQQMLPQVVERLYNLSKSQQFTRH